MSLSYFLHILTLSAQARSHLPMTGEGSDDGDDVFDGDDHSFAPHKLSVSWLVFTAFVLVFLVTANAGFSADSVAKERYASTHGSPTVN